MSVRILFEGLWILDGGKGLEQSVLLFLADANALVNDLDADHVLVSLRNVLALERNRHARARPTKLDCVGQQVYQNLLDSLRVELKHEVVWELFVQELERKFDILAVRLHTHDLTGLLSNVFHAAPLQPGLEAAALDE